MVERPIQEFRLIPLGSVESGVQNYLAPDKLLGGRLFEMGINRLVHHEIAAVGFRYIKPNACVDTVVSQIASKSQATAVKAARIGEESQKKAGPPQVRQIRSRRGDNPPELQL